MEKRSQALLSLAKAKLSRRIAFWVFVSIVVIEAIILVPSYFRREQELIEKIESISTIQTRLFLQAANSTNTDQQLLDLARSVKKDTNVTGWSLEDKTGRQISRMGEQSPLTAMDVRDRPIARLRSADNRYNVAWNGRQFGSEYVLVVRHDVSFIKQELIAYVWRIIGLVVIISLFVTASTLVILGAIVILPVLKLREDLELVGDSISREQADLQFHSMLVTRNDEVGDVMVAFNQMYERVIKEIAERKQAESMIQQEKDVSEQLLLNILPNAIANRLKQGETVIADGFSEATVLFADIVNFTELSASISPIKLVCLLNEIFSEFDGLAEKYRLEKIKTIGDAYMVVGGIPMYRPDHAEAIADMALDMQKVISKFADDFGEPFKIRIGINTGSVVAGVIGIKKFIYDLWGDTVNIASRMESHGLSDHIQVSDITYAALKHKYSFTDRGKIEVKGKGEMQTYFLNDKLSQFAKV
ncbi:MAG: adenylate/guanylate cyclase domain-containing protein [Oscillatoriales cyanobacterium CG2_30_44_21]|nr:MAG: adenylate/guanylate cyclase domain-containing protein [Oscillatoriales cyanobacterium CG2_30_44_21]